MARYKTKGERQQVETLQLTDMNDITEPTSEWADLLNGLSQQEITLKGSFCDADTQADEWFKQFEGTRMTLRLWRSPYWLFSRLERVLRLVKLGHWCYREFSSDKVRFEASVTPMDEEG